jgi:hypothetical protein
MLFDFQSGKLINCNQIESFYCNLKKQKGYCVKFNNIYIELFKKTFLHITKIWGNYSINKGTIITKKTKKLIFIDFLTLTRFIHQFG